jgi:hypothetical protein
MGKTSEVEGDRGESNTEGHKGERGDERLEYVTVHLEGHMKGEQGDIAVYLRERLGGYIIGRCNCTRLLIWRGEFSAQHLTLSKGAKIKHPQKKTKEGEN